MALSDKPDMSVLWAETGSTEQPETIKIQQGWVNEIPPFEYQNWWQLRVDQVIRHIYESGIPAWDANTSYTAWRSFVQASNGEIYRAIANNVGQNPLTTTSWTPLIDATKHVPPGQIGMFAGTYAPPGWLKANGAQISRSAYAELFSYIGTQWGAGNGSTTFNIPDLRGVFPRFWDDGKGIDLNRAFGNIQDSQNRSHSHNGETTTNGDHVHTPPGGGLFLGRGGYNNTTVNENDETFDNQVFSSTSTAGNHNHSFTTNSSGGVEARPINISLLACIKY